MLRRNVLRSLSVSRKSFQRCQKTRSLPTFRPAQTIPVQQRSLIPAQRIDMVFSCGFSTLPKGHPSTYVYKVSPDMIKVIGQESAKRGEVLKLIWEYVKKNDLKGGKGEIKCDDTLKKIFDNKSVIKNTEVMKYMSKHILERVG
mmetsp:Transcript_18932/g.24720  ORF Transcript_18932/g.24720 Transcript_18932/m.24720 type:complete len:144 (+) Transcript_18932:230-661(+)